MDVITKVHRLPQINDEVVLYIYAYFHLFVMNVVHLFGPAVDSFTPTGSGWRLCYASAGLFLLCVLEIVVQRRL